MNFILNSDSYKWSHYLYYPENTTEVYSYAESRGGRYPETLFFGLQAFLREYLSEVPSKYDIDEAVDFAEQHGVPFNREGWDIINKYGSFPVEIKAVPEGSLIPTRNVLATVVNTDPRVPFITSYLETALLRAILYPTTVATRIYNMKKKMKKYFDETSDEGNMDFALLDFSARGCSSLESNKIGGAAYLTLFKGSDSVAAVDYVNQNYNSAMSGFSVPATEHSIMCAYGQEDELESFKRIIDQTPEGGIISVVSDTWNIFEAVKKWCILQDKIYAKNLTLVIRPDSGEVSDVLPEVLKILQNNWLRKTNNKKGYTVFGNLKILWGDGINEDTCVEPFKIAKMLGVSADSIMVGSGGGLMQNNIDRDTCKFAFKASNVIVNGESLAIAKNPITDSGKKSKKGKFQLIKIFDPETDQKETTYRTIAYNQAYADQDVLRTVYRNGEYFNQDDIETIRNRITF